MNYERTLRWVKRIFGTLLSPDFSKSESAAGYIVYDALYGDVLGHEKRMLWKTPYSRKGLYRVLYRVCAYAAYGSVYILRKTGDKRRILLDHAFSRGWKSTLLSLGIVTAVSIGALSYSLHVYREETGGEGDYVSALFAILYKILNTGAIEDIGGSATNALIMIVAIVAGITLMSTLIGVINNAITEKIDEVRTANTPVSLRGHVAIIGYSMDAILAALLAGGKRKVAVLGNITRSEMEEGEAELRLMTDTNIRTSITYRYGTHMFSSILNLVQPQYAACTMILHMRDSGDVTAIAAFNTLLESKVRRTYLELEKQPASCLLASYDASSHTVLVAEELDDLCLRLIAEFGVHALDVLLADVCGYENASYEQLSINVAPHEYQIGMTLGECFMKSYAAPVGIVRGGVMLLDYDARIEKCDRLCVGGLRAYNGWDPDLYRDGAHIRRGSCHVALHQRILCVGIDHLSVERIKCIPHSPGLTLDYYMFSENVLDTSCSGPTRAMTPDALLGWLTASDQSYTRVMVVDLTAGVLDDQEWLAFLHGLREVSSNRSIDMFIYCYDYWAREQTYRLYDYYVLSHVGMLIHVRTQYILHHAKMSNPVLRYDYELLRRFLLICREYMRQEEKTNPFWELYEPPTKVDYELLFKQTTFSDAHVSDQEAVGQEQ